MVACAVVVAALLGLAGACTGPAAPSGERRSPSTSGGQLPAAATTRMDALLEDWVAGANGIGVTAAVVTPGGTWAGAAGVDGAGRSLVPEAAMAIGAVSSTFVAAEVLLLADRGSLDLGAPLSDYVTLPFDPRGASVRQALNMRSGLPVDPFEAAVPAIAADLDRVWTPADVVAAADPTGPRAGQRGGTQFVNGLNMVVLAMVVEAVTGEPVARTLRADLIEPAGLPRMWVQPAEEPEPPLAVAERDPDGLVDPTGAHLPSLSAASWAGAAGGLAGDAPSLARWGQQLYGGEVLPPEIVDRMTSGGPDDVYGLGTERTDVDGERVVGHGSATPGYQGVLYVLPDRSISVAVLVPNRSGAHLGEGVDADDLALELSRTATAAAG